MLARGPGLNESYAHSTPALTRRPHLGKIVHEAGRFVTYLFDVTKRSASCLAIAQAVSAEKTPAP